MLHGVEEARPMDVRPATAADLDRAVETITLAFATDPVWSLALARPDGSTAHHAAYWRFFVADAIDQGSVAIADDGAAVSVWIPPGGEELRPATVHRVDAFVLDTLGEPGAAEMAELFERFEANHPRTEPHAYLSLLATHPDHRGRGIGQMLLAANLRTWDERGVPAYLESTNPANDHRYERAGFRRVGGFVAVRDRAPITTMWRPVGGA
jgi:GNAT superfamily N-acetyltransferase